MDIARRLAAQLLQDNGHLGRFDVELVEPDNPDKVAQALREFGCLVHPGPKPNFLDVICPGEGERAEP